MSNELLTKENKKRLVGFDYNNHDECLKAVRQDGFAITYRIIKK